MKKNIKKKKTNRLAAQEENINGENLELKNGRSIFFISAMTLLFELSAKWFKKCIVTPYLLFDFILLYR